MRSLQWALMKADKTFLSFFPASVQSELLRLASLEYKREKKTTPCRSSIQLDPSWFNCKTTSKLSICEKRRKKRESADCCQHQGFTGTTKSLVVVINLCFTQCAATLDFYILEYPG